MHTVEVSNLAKRFGDTHAVVDVSFAAEAGEIFGLLGPNGAGKTTTIRMMLDIFKPDAGSISVFGGDLDLEKKRRIGYLPENPPLYNDLRVEEYLEFTSKIKGVSSDKRKEAISTAIEKAALQSVSKQVIGSLSKGFKQRVGLAQSLLNDPEILILDEPTIGLDPRQIIEIRELIKNLKGDHTVILSTHILPEVEMTCGRVVIINEGEVVAEDTPTNLTKRLKGTEKTVVEVEGCEKDVKSVLDGFGEIVKVDKKKLSKDNHLKLSIETNSDIRRDLAQAFVKKGIDLYELRTEAYSLEEIFLHLTTKEEVA